MTPTADEIAAEIKALVKPLEWAADGDGHWKAGALTGSYHVLRFSAGGREMFRLHLSWSLLVSDGDYTTLDEAKAAAQADYTRRILSALNPDVLAAYEAQRAEIAARDALIAEAREAGWRPIDTCPEEMKDGREVDLWVQFPNKAVRWADATFEPLYGDWCSDEGFHPSMFTEQPVVVTHYRVVSPPAPTKENADG